MLQITNKGGKDMKKIGILLIALMVISVGFLSGCEEKEESYSIIGQWSHDSTVLAFYEDGTGIVGNGTMLVDMTYELRENTLTLTGKFELSVGFFVFLGAEFSTSVIYKYEFQDKDTLIIKESTGEEATWTRI